MSWPKKIVEWTKNNNVYLSVVFTWNLPDAWSRCIWYRQQGYDVHAGGVAVSLFPDYLTNVAKVNDLHIDALSLHNKMATRFSIGCVNKCPFCAVPIIEGDLKLREGKPLPIVCDNNALALPRKHFDYMIDKLKPVRGIDFNQGLDCRLIKQYHIDRIRELDIAYIRFAWDNINEERYAVDAVNLCLRSGIPKYKIKFYVLVGFHDTPEDALYRMQKLRSMGVMPIPMRYQPIKGNKALVKDSYIEDPWTEYEMHRFIRYWFRQNWFNKIPYGEFKG